MSDLSVSLSLVSKFNTVVFQDSKQQAFKEHVGKMHAYTFMPTATEWCP